MICSEAYTLRFAVGIMVKREACQFPPLLSKQVVLPLKYLHLSCGF